MNPSLAVYHLMFGCLADIVNDYEGPRLLLFSASPIIVHQIIRMIANTFNRAGQPFKFQQFYRMQSDAPNVTIPESILVPKQRKYMTITQRERHFEAPPVNSSRMAYNAIDDKYAFGYFQSRQVQHHLKKLLKNAKQMPPSADNRKIITTLSQKILPPAQSKARSKTIESEREQLSPMERHGRIEERSDIFYPYKIGLKLKSLEKIKRNIERKENQLRLAEEKKVYFPRLRTISDDNSHQKTMHKLIERQDRMLASKKIISTRFKHADFMNYLAKNQPAAPISKEPKRL